jgi:hypothetical protein
MAGMSVAGVTLNQFVKIGLTAALFILLLKFAVMRLPAPEGLRSAIGAI